jgi:hypothetical protein
MIYLAGISGIVELETPGKPVVCPGILSGNVSAFPVIGEINFEY